MNYGIREITQSDVPFLWEMLFHAAHMQEDGATSAAAAKDDKVLAPYVENWGRQGDLGFVAYDCSTGKRVGACWVRLMSPSVSNYGYFDEHTPELAIAVLPQMIGHGVGSALMNELLAASSRRFPAIVLTVRKDNPAKRLYERLGFVVVDKITNRVGTMSYKMLIRFNA